MSSCKSAALCLFDEQDVQMDITGTITNAYYPQNALIPGAPIEFRVLGTPDDYIDMGNIKILLRLKINRTDKKGFDANDKVIFINQPVSSVFQDVFLKINETQVEGGQHVYPYNAYLSSLLHYHPSAKASHMQSWGWYEDEPEKFDDATNDGAIGRMNECKHGKQWEVMGPLFLDLTRQPRYLLPNTHMSLKLLPAKADFVLQSFGASTNYDYTIEKCILYVPRISVADTVLSGHNKGLEKYNAKYIVNHIDISTFTITVENQTFIKDGLFQSQVPKTLVIGFLEHGAFNGDMKKNPFNFQHFNLNKIGLYRDGELVPGQIFTPDYDNDFFTRAYNNTMSTLHYFDSDDSNGMTLEHFKSGYNLYAFNLSPDHSNQGPHRHLMKTGSLRLEVGFKNKLATPLTVVLFSIIDAKVEVTKLRDVLMSYSR